MRRSFIVEVARVSGCNLRHLEKRSRQTAFIFFSFFHPGSRELISVQQDENNTSKMGSRGYPCFPKGNKLEESRRGIVEFRIHSNVRPVGSASLGTHHEIIQVFSLVQETEPFDKNIPSDINVSSSTHTASPTV